ncbi:MAG TPA: hypothetical protein VNH83_28185 [Bryobacteraceae bacterium]|nr:hypothetical protein [Bryobacteraceae bacterium]
MVIVIPEIEVPDLRAERIENLEKKIYECQMRCYHFINQSLVSLDKLESSNRALIERGAPKTQYSTSDRISDKLRKHVDACTSIVKALAASQLANSSYFREPPAILPPAEVPTEPTIEMRSTGGYVPANPTDEEWMRESKHGEKIVLSSMPLASRKEQ